MTADSVDVRAQPHLDEAGTAIAGNRSAFWSRRNLRFLDKPSAGGGGPKGHPAIRFASASLPFGPGDRERHIQIELACRFYGSGWLTLGQGARVANLDHYAFGVALAERGIPSQYGVAQAQEDLAHAGNLPTGCRFTWSDWELWCNAPEAVKELKKGAKTQNAPTGNQRLEQTSFCHFQFFHSFPVKAGTERQGRLAEATALARYTRGRLGEPSLPSVTDPFRCGKT